MADSDSDKPRIAVIGPVAHDGLALNYVDFDAAKLRVAPHASEVRTWVDYLRAVGIRADATPPFNWRQWRNAGLGFVGYLHKDAGAVALMDNWQASADARLFVHHALAMNRPLYRAADMQPARVQVIVREAPQPAPADPKGKDGE